MIIESDIEDIFADFSPNQSVLELHPRQKCAYYDNARFKCVLAGRQSGKSHLDAAWLLGGGPGQESLYFASSIKSAWTIMRSVFVDLNQKYEMGLKILQGKGIIEEPNGHIIRITGVKDINAAESLRGQRFRRICGDEAGVYNPELLEFTIKNVLQPTLLKHGGEMMINGTPDIEPEGFWFDLCGDPYSNKSGLWPTYHWTVFDNPHINHKLVIRDILKANGWTMDHPTFQREYLARWVVDRGALIYEWGDKPLYDKPAPTTGTTVLAMDFGYHPDATAFVVLRMGVQPKVHIIKAFKVWKQDPHSIGQLASQLMAQYRPNHVVCDEGGLGKSIAAGLRGQFQLWQVQPADKQDKHARIQTLRGMIGVGNLEIHPEASGIIDEMKRMPWGPVKKNGFKEHHPKYEDDLLDATLYGVSKMIQVEPWKPPVDPRTIAEKEMEEMRQRAMNMRSGRTSL